MSGNTAEVGTSATFKGALSKNPALSVPSVPSVSGSDFFDITNISGNTKEGGNSATFKVALDSSPAGPAPVAPFVSGSENFNITNISGNTSEGGTAATFKVSLKDDSLFPSTPPSVSNKALDFDGTNDYVTTPIDADRQVMPSTTWSGWIKAHGSGGWQVIFGMEDGGWDRMLIVKSGSTKFCMGHTSGCWEPGPSITPGVWQHVVSIYDNGAMRFYLNGAEYTTNTNEGNHSSNGTFTIGANQNGSGNRYKGLIDEVAVWDKALSASEITALYNSGKALNASSNAGNYNSADNLVGYWKMDEGSGTSISDSSGNSKTATLSNMTNDDWVAGIENIDKSNFNITTPSGHTTEAGTTSTFNVALLKSPALSLAAPTAPSSDFYNISTPSGHTSEAGTTSTFNVSLKNAPEGGSWELIAKQDNSDEHLFQQTLELLSLKMQMTLASQPLCPSVT